MDAERTLQAITDAYCIAENIPITTRTTEAERDAALEHVEASAYAQGRQAGLRLLSVEMCPLGGALAEVWQLGRMAGLAERLRGGR